MANAKRVLYVKPKSSSASSPQEVNQNSLNLSQNTTMATKTKSQSHHTDAPISNFMTEGGISDEKIRQIVQPRDKDEFNSKIDAFLKETEGDGEHHEPKQAHSSKVEAIADVPADEESNNSVTEKRKAGRPKKTAEPVAEMGTANQEQAPAAEKRKAGRPKKNAEPAAEMAPANQETPAKRRNVKKDDDKVAQVQSAVDNELESDEDDSSNQEQAPVAEKRKAGRPKKNAEPVAEMAPVNQEQAPVAEKRKAGRPKKNTEPTAEMMANQEQAPAAEKRKAGRPKKNAEPLAEMMAEQEQAPATEKRKAGRPKKNAEPVAEMDNDNQEQATTEKRKAGRPKKDKLEAPEVAVVDRDEDVSEIIKTKEYDSYVFAEQNRDLDLKHVKELVESITEKNLLSSFPIIVNSKREILDGQHRYEAAKFLDLSFYVKVDDDFKPADIALINTVSKKWQLEDYLKLYRSQGNPEYATLESFIDQYKVNIYSAIGLLSGRTAQPNNDLIAKFKDGKFQITAYEHAVNVLVIRNSYSDYSTDFYKSKTFLNVVSKLVKDPDYNTQKMLSQIAKQPRAFVKCTTVIQYLEMFTEIYNYGARKGDKVDFTKDAKID